MPNENPPASPSPSDPLPLGGAGEGSKAALERLRSASKTEQGRAINSLYARINERAERMAVKMMGSKAQRVDLQPESVVMSVMAKELPKLAVVCNDDQHLEARLLRAIRNRFIDRLRARKDVNPDSRDADGEQANFDTADGGDGPRSVVMAFEQSGHERDALLKLVCRLTAACKSDDERTMVEQFLVKNQSWSVIASQLGKNETAAKVAFSRLRQRLLEHVMEPLRFALSGPEWAVVQNLCVERRTLGEAAAAVGASTEHVMGVFQTRVLPALRAEYGAAGIESLVRLIGKVRTDDTVAKAHPAVVVKPAEGKAKR
jgi:DNA-directed RNA polymerase specialized sigma24 family protein